MYRSEHIRFKDGLPSATVLYTFKKDGFLYIATQGGLCRYDGYLFVKAPDVSHSVLYVHSGDTHIYFEEAGTGLCEKKDIFSAKRLLQGVQFTDADPDNDHFQYLYRDKRGYIWASDFHHIKYLNPQTGIWRNFSLTEDNLEQELVVNYLPQGKDLLVATSVGLFSWSARTNTLSAINKEQIISAITLDARIFLSTNDGKLLQYFPDKQELKLIFQDDIGYTFVQNTPNDQQVLMCYNNRELFTYDLNTGERQSLFTTEDALHHVYYDQETQGFWLATENGLVHLRKSNDRIQDLLLPDPGAFPLKTVVQDSRGAVWCLDVSGFVWKRDIFGYWKAWKMKEKVSDISWNFNNLYLSTQSGLFRIPEGGKLQRLIPTAFEVKKALVADDKVWLLPARGRPVVYDAASLKELKDYIAPDSVFYASHFINDLTYAQGKVWLACWAPKDFGIACFDTVEKVFKPISRIPGNSDLFVGDYYNRIAATDNLELLFSAFGGWNSVAADGRILKRMHTREQHVANDNIQGIAKDSDGNIWFGCAEGLYQYNPYTGNAIRLSEVDGLAANNITHAFYLNQNDQLLVSAGKALQQIDLKKVMRTQLIGRLALSAVKVNDSIWTGAPQTIRLEEKNAGQVELYFSALNFSDKEKVVYRYRFGKEPWNYLGVNPRLLLIKPVHGSYDITIQAGDNLGTWQEKSLQLRLDIIPPFYKTKWFYGLMALCALLLAWSINRYLVRQEKQKGKLKRKVKENENRMLRSQMNPHFLFNSLNSINSFILQSKKEEASAYLTAFSRLMRRILDHSRRERINLLEELETIKIYLDLEAARLDGKFDYSIQVKYLDVDQEEVLIPPLILQPFLENAIWHGISNKPDKGFIDIIISPSPEASNRLLIKIIDDGAGRKAAARFGQGRKTHKSQGLDITAERLRMSDVGNEVEIVDLIDEASQPCGTMILLKITYHYD